MRVALHTRVKQGREIDYERAHRNVPAPLVAAIREAGAQRWTIWRSGQDLFHVIECDDYESMLSSLESLPVNVAWQERIGELLEVTHDYSDAGADAALPAVWDLEHEPHA
jgi:L-rhamnose mutarotase